MKKIVFGILSVAAISFTAQAANIYWDNGGANTLWFKSYQLEYCR